MLILNDSSRILILINLVILDNIFLIIHSRFAINILLLKHCINFLNKYHLLFNFNEFNLNINSIVLNISDFNKNFGIIQNNLK